MKQDANGLLKTTVISAFVLTGVASVMVLTQSNGLGRDTSKKTLSERSNNPVEVTQQASSSYRKVGMANPASKYCKDMGFTLETVKEAGGGQHSVCVFPDDTSCDTWAFLEGRCGREFSICADKGLDVITTDVQQNAFSRYTALCVDGNKIVASVPQLMRLTNISNSDLIEVSGSKAAGRTAPSDSSTTKIAPAIAAALPTSFDWRDRDGQDWTTPPKDQAACGSCFAFSAVGTIETALNIAADDPHLDPDLAEEYVISDCLWGTRIGDCCGGTHSTALQVAVDTGIPDESCMPYDVDYYNTEACTCLLGRMCNEACTGRKCNHMNCDEACDDMDRRMTKIKSWTRIPEDRDNIKNAIVNSGALSANIAMVGKFGDDKIYRCTTCWDKNGDELCDITGKCDTANGVCISDTGTSGVNCESDADCNEDRNVDGHCDQENDCLAGHAIVLVGYDDDDGYWIVKNSWGTTWNDEEKGFFKVGYDECHIEDDVCSVQVDTQPNECSESNAIDLGQPGSNITVPNNACIMVRDNYPTWWATRDMLLQNPAPGTYPVSFEWKNTCSESSGHGSITGDWQSHVLSETSDQCATLINLKGDGSGTVTVRYYGR